MARSIKIPLHILRSKISPSAKLLWIELSLVSSPKRPQVMVQPEELAAKMNLSVRTIRRLVAELVKAQLLIHNGYILRRVKTYHLVWKLAEVAPIVVAKTPSGFQVEVLETWRKRFVCLDGLSGRPKFEDCVNQAMGHSMRKKDDDPKIWVELWLQSAEKMWIGGYNRERYFDEIRRHPVGVAA